jgi:hypothetical protein
LGKSSRIVNRKNKEIEALARERDELFNALMDVEEYDAVAFVAVSVEGLVTTSIPSSDRSLFVDEDGFIVKLGCFGSSGVSRSVVPPSHTDAVLVGSDDNYLSLSLVQDLFDGDARVYLSGGNASGFSQGECLA